MRVSQGRAAFRRFDHIDEMLDVARNGSNDLKLAKKRIAVVPLSSRQDSGLRATLRSSAAQIDAPRYRAAGPSCPAPKAGRCNDGSKAPFPRRPERRLRLVASRH